MNWESIKKRLSLFGLIIGAVFFILQFMNAINSFRIHQNIPVHSTFFLLSWIPMVLVVALQIFKWKLLLRSLAVDLPYQNLAKGYVLTSLPKYIPGSIWGYLSRSQWLHKNYGVNHSTANLSNIFEIEITLISAMTILLVWFSLENFPGFTYLLGGFFPFVYLLLTKYLFRWLSNINIFGFGNIQAKSIITRWRILAYVISLVEWALLGYSTLLLLRGFSLSLGFNVASWFSATYSFTLSWVGGFLIFFFPGGLGIREYFLSNSLFTNFSLNQSIAPLVAIGTRIVYSLAEFTWIIIGSLLKKFWKE